MRLKLWALFVVYMMLGTAVGGGVNNKLDGEVECPPADTICESDKYGFEAIQVLHNQIDDDHNGNLDRSESDEFLRDELAYEDGFDRHSNFHGTDDLISIHDLWHHWIRSDVYNWTADDIIEWLVEDIELPQYEETFKVNAVTGRSLPRIAANVQYTKTILGIENAVHRQKLALKAMDAVLFGPPKKAHNYIKDLALVASLVIAIGGCWLAYVQHRYSQHHLKKVMKDLDTLQKAEESLTGLQKKLEEAQKEQKNAVEEKSTIELRMKNEICQAKQEADRLCKARDATEEEISRLRLAEEELAQVRKALRRAEKQIEDRQSAPLAELQQWLQLTYEIETQHYERKRLLAESQLFAAKEMCEKIRRKRGAFLGSLRIAHTTSIDDTDHKIMSARAALDDVKMDLQERSQRWTHIEKICGFNIILNPGLAYLDSLLRPGSSLTRSQGATGSMSPLTVENADEDIPPGYAHAGGTWPSLMQAGMQLSMVGLGAKNPKATLDRRVTTLTSIFGDSHESLDPSSSSYSTVPSGSHAHVTAHPQPSDSDSQGAESDASNQGITAATKPVKFHLGGDRTPSCDELDALTDQPVSSESNVTVSNTAKTPPALKTSTSHPTSAKVTRPHTLPSSLSESTLTDVRHTTSDRKSPQPVRHRTSTMSPGSQSAGLPSPSALPEEDDNSSPESTDSASVDEHMGKKKKRSKLLQKILGKDSAKSKHT